MKKYKYLLTILIFFAILFIANNVRAESRNYGYMICNGERWKTNSDCSEGTIIYDALTITYNEEDSSVNLFITEKAFEGATNEEAGIKIDTFKKERSNYYSASGTYSYLLGSGIGSQSFFGEITNYYDLSSLQSYYNKTKSIPDNIVVFEHAEIKKYIPDEHYININADVERYYYFGVSDYDLSDKKVDSKIYFSVGDKLNTANSCIDLAYYKQVLEEKVHKFGPDSDEVSSYASAIGNKCEDYLGFNDNPNDMCYAMCRDLDSFISDIGVDLFNTTNSCGIGERMVAWIIRVLKIIRFIVPTLVIILTTFEYITAFMSAEDDAIKKVGGRLGKRLFIMILFLVLPSLIQFIINVFNVDGLDSSNPYCLK